MAQWQLEWCSKCSQSLRKASSVAWGNQGGFQVSVIFLNFTPSSPPAPNHQWSLTDLRTRSKFLSLIAKSYPHLVSPQLLTLRLPLFFSLSFSTLVPTYWFSLTRSCFSLLCLCPCCLLTGFLACSSMPCLTGNSNWSFRALPMLFFWWCFPSLLYFSPLYILLLLHIVLFFFCLFFKILCIFLSPIADFWTLIDSDQFFFIMYPIYLA